MKSTKKQSTTTPARPYDLCEGCRKNDNLVGFKARGFGKPGGWVTKYRCTDKRECHLRMHDRLENYATLYCGHNTRTACETAE